ncbi:hypothetical protein PIB30_068331 [Stylosanthes scabra]|uniref:Embryo defective 2759 n=1 Tax=Stylosanthes scabra TaxID=79078 RepID=A0ABU6WQN9_9FABA|nr:hypothetical protein [Stylosanthes scabra]
MPFSSRRSLCSKRLKLKQCLTKSHLIGRADWHCISKQNICLSVGPPCIGGFKVKPLRIAGFKGTAQNDDSGTKTNGLKVPKTSVRLEESGEFKSESPNGHSAPVSFAAEANESIAPSPGIHKLFRKWLTMLRTQPSDQEGEEILGEPPPEVLPETLEGTQRNEKVEALKVAWSHFVALDATIKIPLIIFAPLFLFVNVKHGAEVAKELTPLWVMGPLIVALEIMFMRWVGGLYVFAFKQTIKIIKNFPSYCVFAFTYVFRGKLKEDINAYIFQPLLRIKNANYKKMMRRRFEAFAEWIMERYLDFVESIWPYYCRTIRFLKRANLI